jgi:hypothetical protein
MKYITTYFDINFLPRGMALLDSLEINADNFILYILALDDEVVQYFKNLNNKHVEIITLEEYSIYFSIDKTKYKDKKEFYFSLTPSLCLYVLKKFNNINILLYLDADVYLFNDIEILYDEIGDASISICSQRLPWYTSKKYGTYNVGVNSFRNDDEGLKCLNDWYSDCNSWKPNQEGYSLSFFSDQIWLDKWPYLYKNIKIIEHIGINTAPWNSIQYNFTIKNNQYYINKELLVVYHFSSLKGLGNNRWHGNTSFTIHNISGILLDIYKRYIVNIEKYTIQRNNDIVDLKFSGNKIKMIVYKILKIFHNHHIKIDKDIK